MNEAPMQDPAYPVRMQLEAYNARDIDAFMAWWAEDCRCYAFPDTLLAEGAAEIRARHIERFREPGLFGRLLSRAVVGNLVVDHETVRRSFPEGPGEVDVICLYEVEGGKIARAWFRMGERRLDPPTA
ncbi:nuclear transport factor 2 family protein [Roseomonas sp. GC11]|uniref:nuclear transport factor 2 family protein n=1 Tax=Roseomonas sp. GC11 TaxID=2950546 RepID=UPI00210B8309|nr:nuclear transport factor 2 family protein [Roseomonas sp. GC11]MCQ4160433.1 nuclear transport factor 2 family protein [Roseomonas sp. GC11]